MIQRNQGFTLVELLIAISILLMVLFIGSFAYKQYSQYWYKELGDFELQLEKAKSLTLLHSVIRNIRPHMIKRQDGLWFHYFEGGNTLIRSITAQSVQNPKRSAYFELSTQEDEGKLKIRYKEKVIDSQPLINKSQISEYDYETELDLDLQGLLFEFKGWKHADDYFESQENENKNKETWFGFYSGEDTLVTPSIVKLTLVTELNDSELMIPIPAFIPEHIQFYSLGNE